MLHLQARHPQEPYQLYNIIVVIMYIMLLIRKVCTIKLYRYRLLSILILVSSSSSSSSSLSLSYGVSLLLLDFFFRNKYIFISFLSVSPASLSVNIHRFSRDYANNGRSALPPACRQKSRYDGRFLYRT